MSNSSPHKQDWNAPGLHRDLLMAMIDHLAVSRQDILQVAEKAKAVGGWEYSTSGL